MNQRHTIEESLLYFAECQIATLETVNSIKRSAKNEKARHLIIARMMVEDCERYCGMHPGLDHVRKRFDAAREPTPTPTPEGEG